MFKIVISQIFTSSRHITGQNVKIDKDFGRKPDFKDVKVPVRIRDIYKTEKKWPTLFKIFTFLFKFLFRNVFFQLK